MLVANSFDLWRKDTFFSAAEEVQQSADIMESTYRTWLRARREGLFAQHLEDLERELQMALGTAKWQLEEFEKAVCMSYRNRDDNVTATRHKQFVSAMEDQISRVEAALKESFNEEGKKPFRWVNLDADECNDLALFLSGTSCTAQAIQDKGVLNQDTVTILTNKKDIAKQHSSLGSEVNSKTQGSNQEDSSGEAVVSNNEIKFPEAGDEPSYQMASNRRTWCSPDRSALEVVIDINDTQNNELPDVTPKEKGSKPFTGKGGILSRTPLKIINQMKQHLRGSPRSQRQQVSPVLPVHSIRFVLLLMLSIFLVGMCPLCFIRQFELVHSIEDQHVNMYAGYCPSYE